jgi:hypothetical protein
MKVSIHQSIENATENKTRVYSSNTLTAGSSRPSKNLNARLRWYNNFDGNYLNN